MEPGLAEVLLEGDDVVLWAYGAMVEQALAAAAELQKRGARVGVVDARFCKPLDEDLLARHAQQYRHVVTIEEHQRAAGFGSAVLEAHSRIPGARARVRVLGIGDGFVEHMTTREEQLAKSGIDADGIARVVQQCLRPSLI